MIKRLTIFMVLMLSYMSASAQIATPLLDRVMKVQSPAAAGWRDGTTVGIQAVKAKGKIDADGTEIGDAEIGGSIPGVLAAYKGEEIGAELYIATDTTKTSEMDVGSQDAMPAYYMLGRQEAEDKLPETRLNLAYVFGEAVSVGLGYRSNVEKHEESTTGTLYIQPTYTTTMPYADDVTSKTTETGLMVSASIKLAEMFYLAAGMENVTEKYSSGSTDTTIDWSNTILGLGLLVGEESESRLRVEYSMIQTPETESSDKTRTKYKTDYNTMSLEAIFGGVLLSYISETEKIDANDEKIVTTQIGAGWMPEEGLSISAYSFGVKRTLTQMGKDVTAEPKGWRINIGWNF